jgi:hypothetical protein
MKFFLALILVFCGLGHTHIYSQLFSLLPKEQTGIDFTNHVVESRYLNIFTYEYLFNGSGTCIGDINNDGLNDVFFAGNMMANKLYINKGSLKFEDISKSANVDKGEGFNTGACMMDVNGDGWLDIYVCKSAIANAKYRTHNMYINNKNNTFTDRASEMGLSDSSYSTMAYFADFDNDNDLDLFLLNHPSAMGEAKKIILTYDKDGKLVTKKPETYQYISDRLFINENGKFVDRSEQAGIQDNFFGLSAMIGDYNDDGYNDIFVANDYTGYDRLFINNKNNSFTDSGDYYLPHFSYNSMGSNYADMDNDGLDDLFVVDMLPEENYRQKQFRQTMEYDQYAKLVKHNYKSQFVKNVFQKRIKNKKFADISHTVGLANTDWSWAPLMADFDNNGHKDLYISNGYYHDFTDQDFMKYKLDSIRKIALLEDNIEKLRTILESVPIVRINNIYFANEGNMNLIRNPPNTGLEYPSVSNSAAYGDLDNDGDLEIIVSNINQEVFVFKNNLIENKGGNFLRIKLVSKKTPNAIYRAKIYVETPDGTKQYYHTYPISGYMSSHEHITHIGLAKNTEAKLRIEFPNKKAFFELPAKVNQLMEINIDEAQYQPITSTDPLQHQFEDITAKSTVNHVCRENDYIDYKLEPLIPRKFSYEGPAIAVGDINGDNLEDFFVGGAKDILGGFFIQNTDGGFTKRSYDVFIKDKIYEDVQAAFIDFDKDGDLDLMVSSGGNDYPNELKKYPVRLYINQNSNFTRADSTIFPNIYASSKVLAIEDYNKDGWDDLFIGGSIVPGHYGRMPNSYLMKNIGGRFVLDDFSKQNPKLAMINDAKWIDIDRDGFKDLLAVGEWTAPTVYKNVNGSLQNLNLSLGNFRGWWRSITLADMNGDGIDDIILGNYGTNSRYKGDKNYPMTCLVNDFDKNGSTDVIVSTYYNGQSYPLMIRDNVLDQMPFLKKRFNRYEKYSATTTSTIFTPEELKGSDTLVANFMQSMIIYNLPNGKFSAKTLPYDVQTFPLNAVIPFDINKDGKLDLLLGGNDYNIEIETGRLDAGHGVILENTPDGNFSVNHSNNFNLSGDVKVVKPITIKGEKALLIGRNNEALQILKLPK